mgnify:CR=1 FL=1
MLGFLIRVEILKDECLGQSLIFIAVNDALELNIYMSMARARVRARVTRSELFILWCFINMVLKYKKMNVFERHKNN